MLNEIQSCKKCNRLFKDKEQRTFCIFCEENLRQERKLGVQTKLQQFFAGAKYFATGTLLMIALSAAVILILGVLVCWLWNEVVIVPVFRAPYMTYWQTVGALTLLWIVGLFFGGGLLSVGNINVRGER